MGLAGDRSPLTKKLPKNEYEANRRYRAFVEAYIANGRNGTRAAITAGYGPRCAQQMATKLLTRPKVREILEAREAKLPQITGLSAERTLLEIARLAYFDARKLYREDGSMKTMREMDDDTVAAIASIDVDALGTKLKMHDKNAALEKAAKHLGLYEKDNTQKSPNLNLQIVLVRKDAMKDVTP